MSSQTPALPAGPSGFLACLTTMLRLFGPREWSIAIAGAIGTAVLIAIPAALVENPIFGRSIEARSQDYVLLAITALFVGPILASFALTTEGGSEGGAAAGGFLSFLAVGCPVCNKVAVAALGSSGALSIFGPAQLFLGIAAVVLLGWVLLLRARSVAGSCSLP